MNNNHHDFYGFYKEKVIPDLADGIRHHEYTDEAVPHHVRQVKEEIKAIVQMQGDGVVWLTSRQVKELFSLLNNLL